MKFKFISITSILFYPFAALATATPSSQLPPDAQALLNSLPEKAVTLSVVLERAVQKSDSYEALRVEEKLIEVPQLEAQALTLTTLTASGSYLDSRSEPTSPFSFSRQTQGEYSLGLEKRFQTGTSFKTEISNEKTFYRLPPSFGGDSQYYQSIATFSLSQSLLKDGFGSATRAQIKAADLSSQAARLQHEEKVQNWSLDLSQVFFEAWLAKENHKANWEGLERRRQTLKVTRIRTNRGTSEKPDLLQALSAQTESEFLVKEARLNLESKWRALVLSLKLPKAWLSLDPVLIPLKMGDDSDLAHQSCLRVAKSDQPLPSYSLEALEKVQKSSELRLHSSKSNWSPSVNLVGSYSVNSVDAQDRSETFSEASQGEFPAWSVGIQVSYPLGNPLEKSQYHKAFVDYTQSSSQLQEAKDQLELAWLTLCDQLKVLQSKNKEFAQIVKQQEQRESLESRRFNLGRVPLLNVIQSGDDQTRARQNLIQTQANLQLTSLRILAMDRKLFKRIERYENEKGR